jgi:hypothetical protein
LYKIDARLSNSPICLAFKHTPNKKYKKMAVSTPIKKLGQKDADDFTGGWFLF